MLWRPPVDSVATQGASPHLTRSRHSQPTKAKSLPLRVCGRRTMVSRRRVAIGRRAKDDRAAIRNRLVDYCRRCRRLSSHGGRCVVSTDPHRVISAVYDIHVSIVIHCYARRAVEQRGGANSILASGRARGARHRGYGAIRCHPADSLIACAATKTFPPLSTAIPHGLLNLAAVPTPSALN